MLTTRENIKNRWVLFQVGLLLAALIFCYWNTLSLLVSTWANDQDYSYGFLIPPLALYFVWERRKELAQIHITPRWIGFLLVALSAVIVLLGELGAQTYSTRFSLVLMVFGVILFCYGYEVTKCLWFPAAFLFFMIPLPSILQNKILLPLKVYSSKLATLAMQLVGISVHVEGNIIDLGYMQLQVVDACSGLRFILPMLTLGVVYAYFFERKLWKQAVLVAVTLPLSFFANVFRIAATGYLAEEWSPKAAESFFHDFSGWIVFMLAIPILWGIHSLLKLCSPSTGDTYSSRQGHKPEASASTKRKKVSIVPSR